MEIKQMVADEEKELGRDPQKYTHADFWTYLHKFISVRDHMITPLTLK